jgi:hypothetical protein
MFLDSPHAYHAKYISTPQKHRRKNRKPFFTARVYHLFTIPALLSSLDASGMISEPNS